jgi:hypothetical protein
MKTAKSEYKSISLWLLIASLLVFSGPDVAKAQSGESCITYAYTGEIIPDHKGKIYQYLMIEDTCKQETHYYRWSNNSSSYIEDESVKYLF